MSSKPANPSPDKPVFIFDTHGDWQATRMGQFIFSSRGEYVGYVEGEDVYKQDGEWLGRLSKDGRILRKRSERRTALHPHPPAKPPKPGNLPARAPLPPMMAELTYSIVDVLEEDPDILKRISDLRPDIE
jgi:hypothetical protein